MPRGFLVKRSRRPGGCYRVRPVIAGGAPSEEASRVPSPLPLPLPLPLPAPPRRQEEEEEEQEKPPPEPEPLLAAAWSAGNSAKAALEVPSPAPSLPRTPLPFPLPLPPSLKRPPRPKKPKAARKLSFADEVTTSPVLGLRIKAAEGTAEGAEEKGGGPGARLCSSRGGFVCQLCKEPYADPLALAQHRCSRIVRVEYRCPECHKAFSCPANLASHRRWHKPRPAPGPAVQGKENSRDQHRGAADSACCREAPPASSASSSSSSSSSSASPPGELFLCPYCHKAFRRQAYLRKHLGTHQAGAPASSASSAYGPQQIAFPCHLCGAHFPTADIRDKHRLWHAVREELLLPLGPPEAHFAEQPSPPQPQPQPPPPPQQQIFSCKHCPSTFFSSPGLTRHINKCHPSENRQVLLLQMPLRPGC